METLEAGFDTVDLTVLTVNFILMNAKGANTVILQEEKSDVVQVKNPEYSTPVQQAHHSEENIYSKV